MERIIIIWLSPTSEQRASFEMPTGDMEAASRIFERLTQMALEEENTPMLEVGPKP